MCLDNLKIKNSDNDTMDTKIGDNNDLIETVVEENMNTSFSGENEGLLLERIEGKMDEFMKRSKEDLKRLGMLKMSLI